MKRIVLPSRTSFPKRLYWDIHVRYVQEVFVDRGWVPEYSDRMFDDEVQWYFTLVDYPGHRTCLIRTANRPVKKILPGRVGATCHFTFRPRSDSQSFPLPLPFPTVSFYDWGQARRLAEDPPIGTGNQVWMRQKDYGTAKTLRGEVRERLLAAFPDTRVGVLPQDHYWSRASECAVLVHVPGAYIGSLDRGIWQQMAMGTCVVCPRIHDDLLPFNDHIRAGIHYLPCADDFSDVTEVVRIALADQKGRKKVGRNARNLFWRRGTPETIESWVLECIGWES